LIKSKYIRQAGIGRCRPSGSPATRVAVGEWPAPRATGVGHSTFLEAAIDTHGGIFCLGSLRSVTNWPRMTSNPPDNATAASPDADAWFTPMRFGAILATLIIACFLPVIGGAETFFYRDFAGFGYPLAFHHREAFWHGQMPLWNPLSNCGLPFLAQWNT